MLETTVYIAEGDKEKRDEITQAVNKGTFLRVTGASGDGNTAFDEILKLKPDVVLMGLVLPKLDGFGLMEKLRSNGLSPRIIVLSALTGEGFISRAMSLGASYYLVKPIDYKSLIDLLEKPDVNTGAGKIIEAKRQTKEKSIEEKITNVFISVGIPAHIKGYQFLREAIKLAIEKPDIINAITKQLYPSIAYNYKTTASKVERAIRHAIEVAWNKGRIENINSLFGVKVYTANDKPTNGEFIALVADKMLIESM